MPPPIISYAPPAVRTGWHTLSGIALIVCFLFDALLGTIFLCNTLSQVLSETEIRWQIISTFFFSLGVALVLWSLVCLWLAVAVLAGNSIAVRRAGRCARIGEIAGWAIWLVAHLLLLCLNPYATAPMVLLLAFLFLPAPIGASATRMILRATARRTEPPW